MEWRYLESILRALSPTKNKLHVLDLKHTHELKRKSFLGIKYGEPFYEISIKFGHDFFESTLETYRVPRGPDCIAEPAAKQFAEDYTEVIHHLQERGFYVFPKEHSTLHGDDAQYTNNFRAAVSTHAALLNREFYEEMQEENAVLKKTA